MQYIAKLQVSNFKMKAAILALTLIVAFAQTEATGFWWQFFQEDCSAKEGSDIAYKHAEVFISF